MSKYGVNIRIQSEYKKIRTRINSAFGHFSISERKYIVFHLLAPSELAEVDNNATVVSNQTVNVITSATNKTQTSMKSQVNPTKTANSTSTLKQRNVDFDEDSASGSVDEFSGSGDDSGDGEDAGITYCISLHNK